MISYKCFILITLVIYMEKQSLVLASASKGRLDLLESADLKPDIIVLKIGGTG